MIGPISLDHIIFSLQKSGGISRWWTNHCQSIFADQLPSQVNHGWYINKNIYCNNIQLQIGPPASRLPVLWYLRKLKLPDDIRLHHCSYYRMTSLSKNVPLVYTFHDSWGVNKFNFRSKIKRTIMHKCLSVSDIIHCVSNFSADQLVKEFPDLKSKKIYVVYHGFDSQKTLTEISEIKALCSPFVVFVGRRDGYKNGKIALHAIEKIKDTHLVFVGGGQPTKNELLLMHSAGTANRIHFIDGVQDSGLAWLYKFAVALWYPSLNEGFGFPVLEAASQQCPVLAVSGHSVQEISDDYCNLINVPTVSWLISETRNLINKATRGDKSIAQKISNTYSWDKYKENMKKLYNTLSPGII